jgi:hypothetical protein
VTARALRLLLVLSATATATAAPPAKPAKPAKKDVARQGKSTQHAAPPAAGTRPAPLVNLYNQWTHEFLAVDPRALPPPDVVDHFLRDHYTNKSMRMDPQLIHFVLDAAAHFHAPRVDIVSGFRHPKFNLMLRKKGHQVARDSQHTHGNAIDFFLAHVPTRDLHAWAVSRKAGGVGLYLESGFVHMDTAKVRYWSGD